MIYQILIVGMGSIGKRHLRNVRSFLEGRGDACRIDAVRSGKGAALEPDVSAMLRHIFSYDDTVDAVYDAVFIANPTFLHYETLRRYARCGGSFFIEKPIFDRTDYRLSELRLPPGIVDYVACPLRYHAVLQYVKAHVDCKKAISVRAVCSSYLPDWRPGVDYRNTYSARKDMGGGVSIDLIHEWDYLSWLFGAPEETYRLIEKVSRLETDSDDLAVYIGRNRQTTFELHLDYFGRKTMRELQIFLPDDTVVADLVEGTVTYFKSGRRIDLKEERDGFQMREITHFWDMVDGGCRSDNPIAHAMEILRIAEGEDAL